LQQEFGLLMPGLWGLEFSSNVGVCFQNHFTFPTSALLSACQRDKLLEDWV